MNKQNQIYYLGVASGLLIAEIVILLWLAHNMRSYTETLILFGGTLPKLTEIAISPKLHWGMPITLIVTLSLSSVLTMNDKAKIAAPFLLLSNLLAAASIYIIYIGTRSPVDRLMDVLK